MGEAKRREEYAAAQDLSVTSVTFRDGVYFDGKATIGSKDGEIELHAQGVLVQVTGRARLLVPFSNVKWMQVE